MPSIVFNSGKGSKFDWEADTIIHMLVDETFVPNPDQNTVSDIVAAECSGTGYTRKTATGKAEAQVDASDKVTFDADSPVWTGANFTEYVKGCVTFKSVTNDADHRLLVYNEFPGGTITAVSTGSKQFTIGGVDLTADIEIGDKIAVTGSTGNDGVYTVTAISFSTNTVITVSETVASATAGGRASTPSLSMSRPSR